METRRIVTLAYPDAQSLDVVGPIQVFATAAEKLAAGQPPGAPRAYEVAVAAPEPGPVPLSAGFAIHASVGLADLGPRGILPDTLIVAGGRGVEATAADAAIPAALRRLAPDVRRLCSVCTGAFLLAAAGLLSGRRAATHWASARRLARRHPDVRVEPDPLWVRDGPVWTAAGVTAGMDLALALVEADHGRALALEVARHLVMFARRPGNQSQFSPLLAAQAASRGPLADVCDWILANPGADLSVPALAARACMSPRTFARRFRAETGTSPGAFVARARIDAARRLLEGGRMPIERVAAEAGFGTAETLRLAFRRRLDQTPSDYRTRFPAVGA